MQKPSLLASSIAWMKLSSSILRIGKDKIFR